MLRQARPLELGVKLIADPDEQSEALQDAMALALLKQGRTEPDPDLEDRLRPIDERLARTEQALEEMRKRRTD